LNVTDAALYSNVERITLYRWIQKGVTYRGRLFYLTAVSIAGQYHIEEHDLDRFLEAIGYEIIDDDEEADY
ncbi:unnamed protein product, partial [marine sediment metagenome]